MRAVITAFERSPDRGMGLARAMRVRWALEEVGQPYDVRLLSFAQMKAPGHLLLHPFGQIPTYEDDGLVLFESGAIVLHVAEHHGRLLPSDITARARALTWMFAALSTMEPPIVEREMAMILERDEPWFAQRLDRLEDAVDARLRQFSTWLGDAQWLEGDFSAADLIMASVLLRLKGSPLLDAFPNLLAYLARNEARPAYQRAFAAQHAVFEASQAG